MAVMLASRAAFVSAVWARSRKAGLGRGNVRPRVAGNVVFREADQLGMFARGLLHGFRCKGDRSIGAIGVAQVREGDAIGFHGRLIRSFSDTMTHMFKIDRVVLAAALTAATAFAQAPPVGPAPAGIIAGVGNFSHIVNDLDKSFAFYRDVIGLQVNQAPQMFAGNAAIMDMGNTPGAQSRIASFRIPGSQLGLELIEYKDIDRKPVKPRFQDPGAGNLILTVRDLDAILAKLKGSEGRIQTIGGKAVESPGSKIIFVQDPDGFYLELTQRAAGAGAPEGNILGGGAEIMVESLEQTMKLWKDVLKFDMSAPTEWDGRAEMVNTVGAPGSQFRRSVARIPGTSVTMVFLEFKNIERKKVANRTQDPGQSILQLQTTDIDGLVAQWKAAGGEVVSKGGVPVSMAPGVKLVILKDGNGVMTEVLPARRAAAGKQ